MISDFGLGEPLTEGSEKLPSSSSSLLFANGTLLSAYNSIFSVADPSLTPGQIQKLESLLRAGFRFLTLERYERYLAAEKNGFAALLDPSGGKFTVFSQAGYLMGEGIGMLIEEPSGKYFVYHGQRTPATPDLLAAYEDFKRELGELLTSK